MRNDSIKKTLLVTVLLSLVCSVLVAGAAVLLRPKQQENRELDRQKNILRAADLLEKGGKKDRTIEQIFAERIEGRLVNLETGEIMPGPIPEDYDQRVEAKTIGDSVAIDPADDSAGIKRRAKRVPVYFVKDGETITKLILPVHGKGLWSTMYGFLALEKDAKTIAGITFYEHGETPGLGGEIDNPRWQQSWEGKLAYDEEWRPVIEVIKGSVNPSRPESEHQIDGLSGATITARGVTSTMRYWLSEEGYGQFLRTFRERGLPNG